MGLRGKLLSERSLLIQAQFLALISWILIVGYFVTAGSVRAEEGLWGSDFLQFYTAGAILEQRQLANLYDVEFFQKKAEELSGFRQKHYSPVYPPQVALVFAPLAKLPFYRALYVWWAFSVAAYVFSMSVAFKSCQVLRQHAKLFFFACVGYPCLFVALGFGQISMLLLLLVTLAMVCYSRNQLALAGMLLGLTLIKPQVFASFLVVLAVALEWRVILSAISCGAAQVAAIAGFIGSHVVQQYVAVVRSFPKVNATVLAVRPSEMHSLRGFWYLLLGPGWPGSVATAISILVILGLLHKSLRCHRDKRLRFSLCVIAAMLVNPHVYIYDLAIIGPAIAVLTGAAIVNGVPRGVGVLVYGLFLALALATMTSRFTHVQLSVLLISAILALFASSRSHSPEDKDQRDGQAAVTLVSSSIVTCK